MLVFKERGPLKLVCFAFPMYQGSKESHLGQMLLLAGKVTVNNFGPKSDQHQFSPNNISRLSRVKIMRITKLMTKGRML